ncbi:hypothetical protein ACRRTK_010927 [Alexandromys fortis]
MLPGAQSSESYPDPSYLHSEGPGGTGNLTEPQGLRSVPESLLPHQAPSRGVVLACLTVASRSLPALAEKELTSRLLSTSAERTTEVLRTPPEAAIDPLATTSHLLSLAAVQVWLPQLDPLCLRTGARREPQALPPTEATGNLSEKAQVAGRQARGPEADRLLTLEHTGSETRALTGEDAVETTSSHPGPVLRLPPAWPLGCGADDVPAFCLVCFHREDEELEEVPLQRFMHTVPQANDSVTGHLLVLCRCVN